MIDQSVLTLFSYSAFSSGSITFLYLGNFSFSLPALTDSFLLGSYLAKKQFYYLISYFVCNNLKNKATWIMCAGSSVTSDHYWYLSTAHLP